MEVSELTEHIADKVLKDVEVMFDRAKAELTDEFKARAKSAAQTAAELWALEVAGVDTSEEQKVLAARFKALEAGGIVGVAGRIASTTRTVILGGMLAVLDLVG